MATVAVPARLEVDGKSLEPQAEHTLFSLNILSALGWSGLVVGNKQIFCWFLVWLLSIAVICSCDLAAWYSPMSPICQVTGSLFLSLSLSISRLSLVLIMRRREQWPHHQDCLLVVLRSLHCREEEIP